MKFSTRSEYGLRTMVELARHFGAGPYSLAEVAKKEKISLAYLERIIAFLKRKNLVKASRGKTGGYELIKSPSEVNIGEIVETLEGPIKDENCVLCRRRIDCGTKIVWQKVQKSLKETLNKLTLEDLL